MSIDTLRSVASDLGVASTALAAVAAAIDSRIDGAPLDPALSPHVDAVIEALGLRGALDATPRAALVALQGELRTFAHTAHELTTTRAAGWRPVDPCVLRAAGDATAGLAGVVARSIAPTLEDLNARLSHANGAVLDVGCGVAALSIALARAFPAARVVGVDGFAPALAIARDEVERTGLAARIELREMDAADLADANAFDLAWVPTLFVAGLPRVLAAVLGALRPGGWLLLPVVAETSDPVRAAVARLRTAQLGGSSIDRATAERRLGEIGFAEVRALPADATSTTALLAARKPT